MATWLRLDSYETYAALLAAMWTVYMVGQKIAERRSRRIRDAAFEAGLTEPPSLHPLIDPARCIGCGACTNVCPEGKVLGLINGKAELIDPASCIGHGACKTACPANAISLVFGTATRGVDIPNVKPTFETNVPGLYIAGELGGMGLIANAIEQGRQAIASIAKLDGLGRPELLDVVIVGSGPAGLSASLAAKDKGLRFVTLEQEAFGGAVAHYPRGKIVMTRPADLPLHGKVRFKKVRKERLLALWSDVARRYRLPLRFGERVEQIARGPHGFDVLTSRGRYLSRSVLLSIGRRGSPRKLGIAGEDMPKVVYRLDDAAQYRGQNVLVVGGGDSALETAAALARVPGVMPTLAYRGAAFSRAKPANRKRVEDAAARGHLQILLECQPVAIHPTWVEIDIRGRRHSLPNDAVIVCIGGVLPGDFLRSVGIEVETKFGAP